MKRYLLPALLLAGFFLAGRFWSELSVHAGGGGAFGGNGDVNGDGEINITDVIGILRWLYLGGEAPVACADGGGLTPEQQEILSHLSIVQLDDGQSGTVKTIRLTGANFQIVNGMGQTDSANGLGNLIVGYQELRGSLYDDRRGSHNLVAGMENNYMANAYGGLVVGINNTIAGHFSSVSGGSYNIANGQSSSVSGGNGSTADHEGEVIGDSFSKPRFVDNGDGTVTDKRTRLMWQRITDPTKRGWWDANFYCEDLELAGHKDWRLPSLEELHSIVDETRSAPAIDPVFEARWDWYWSLSAIVDVLGNVWLVHFEHGDISDDEADTPHYLRAVRSGP